MKTKKLTEALKAISEGVAKRKSVDTDQVQILQVVTDQRFVRVKVLVQGHGIFKASHDTAFETTTIIEQVITRIK